MLRSASKPAENEDAGRPRTGKKGAPRRGDEASQSGGAKHRRTPEAEDEVIYTHSTTDPDGDSVFGHVQPEAWEHAASRSARRFAGVAPAMADDAAPVPGGPAQSLHLESLRLVLTVAKDKFRRLWRNLEALMTLPLWEGRLYALRYFLQKAVCLRVQGHVEPLCPLSRDYVEVLTAHRSSLTRMGLDSATYDRASSALAYDLWTVDRPEAYVEDDLFSSEMQLTARDQPPAPEASVSENTLSFM
ncbi:hypothetical protein DL768_004423 [Monosporascus sp. mg162]|nr:hypothetical protein DL768_004423 [Monosporascus sp. mg162]